MDVSAPRSRVWELEQQEGEVCKVGDPGCECVPLLVLPQGRILLDHKLITQDWLVNAEWFARDPKSLLQVGHSLLQLPYSDAKQPRRILAADDCFKLSLIPNEDTVGAVLRSVQKLLGRQVLQHINLGEFVGRNVPSLKEFEKAISNGSSMGALSLLRTAMQLLQS